MINDSLGPLDLWNVYKTHRLNEGHPIPEKVLKYFDRIAEAFDELTQHPPPPNQYKNAIVGALELDARSGGRSPFAQKNWDLEQKRIAIAWVAQERRGERKRGDVAEFDRMIADLYGIQDVETARKRREQALRAHGSRT